MSALSRFALIVSVLCLSTAARAEPIKSLAHRDRLYDSAAVSGELFVVGHPGLLLHSKDRGKTFSRVALPTREALFSIAFNSFGVGAIVGRAGLVLVSTDKGKTWTKTEAKVASDEPTPAAADPSAGEAGAGEEGGEGEEGGGGEGEEGAGGGPVVEELPHLFAVDVLPNGTIVAAGEFGAILRSEDRGKTWSRQPYSSKRPDAPESEEGSESKHRLSIEEENEGAIDEARLTGIRFADDQRGYIVGEFGLVLISEDGGKSWNRQSTDVGILLFDVSVVSRDHAVAVGSEGTVIETKDGTTWKTLESGTREHLYGVSATADRVIVSGAGGTILRRASGQPIKTLPSDVHTWLVSIAFADATHGIIVGGRGYVLRTTDGGAQFKNVFGE